MRPVSCTRDIINTTIAALQVAGRRDEERVVLWLAARPSGNAPVSITGVYEPLQTADIDQFTLPAESLRALMSHLRVERLRVVAQVHSHPGRAFHSEADDAWAIIRHAGALSLVLPYFARETTPENFCEHAAVYELSTNDTWIQVPACGLVGRLEIVG